MKRFTVVTLLYLAFTSICNSQDIDLSIANIPPDLLENANSIIRFEDEHVKINSQRSLTYTIKKAVTVFNKSGDRNKTVVIPYDDNQKVKNYKVIVYNAAGKEIKKVKTKEFIDRSRFDGISLYTDARLKYFDYIPTQYPFTIYYEYEFESASTGFIPPWFPVNQYKTAIQECSYRLSVSPALGLRTQEKNFDGYKISRNVSDAAISYTLKNQPAIVSEHLSPDLTEFTPYSKIAVDKFSLEGVDGHVKNWKDFGLWNYQILKSGNDQVNEAVKSEVLRLVEGITDPIEKAKIIYEYVQGRTRYINVAIGIGGWKPMPAQKVHDLGYGDCKGLTNYTKTLMDVVGVEAYYSILWAGEEKRSILSDFASIQGNHVFLNLPTENGDIWLECTSQKVPFGHLGDFSDDRDVLVVTPEGGIVKHTRKYEPIENLQHSKGKMNVNASGGLKVSLNMKSYGFQYDSHLRWYDGKGYKELKNKMRDYYSHINNIVFDKIEVENDKKQGYYNEEISFSAEDYASFAGKQMLLPINAFNRSNYVPKKVRNRKLPFEFLRGYVDQDEIEIELPKGYAIEFLPESINESGKFGSYKVEISKDEAGNILYKRTLTINEGNYSKDEYEEYRSFRKKVRQYDNAKIILTKT